MRGQSTGPPSTDQYMWLGDSTLGMVPAGLLTGDSSPRLRLRLKNLPHGARFA